jgi:hypothetical protein
LNQSSVDNFSASFHLGSEDQKLTPDLHAWLPNGMVMAASHSGKLAVSFDPSSGRSSLWLGGNLKIDEKIVDSNVLDEEQTENIEEVVDEALFTDNNLKHMVPLKKEILFAGAVRHQRIFLIMIGWNYTLLQL